MESDSSQPIEVTIEAKAWNMVVTNPSERVLDASRLALNEIDRRDRNRIEVSILLSSDERVRDLSRLYRGSDKATNVLSFASFDNPQAWPADGPLLLGDVIVAHETVVREAMDQQKAIDAHLAHLIIHGVLHLLGYDHKTDEDATVMETKETELMALLGYSSPYEDSEEPEVLKVRNL